LIMLRQDIVWTQRREEYFIFTMTARGTGNI